MEASLEELIGDIGKDMQNLEDENRVLKQRLSTHPIDQLLDAGEVKRLLHCSLPWVYKAAEQGIIPCVRIPCPGKGQKKARTMVRFKREDVFAFIEKHYNN